MIIDSTKCVRSIEQYIKNGSVGNLWLDNVSQLPDNLTVEGDLVLSTNPDMKTLPENLIIKGSGLFPFNNFTSLTNTLKIGKENNLDVSYSKNLTHLSSNLNLGILNVTGCLNLKKLPEDLKVSKKIYVMYTYFSGDLELMKVYNKLYNLTIVYTKFRNIENIIGEYDNMLKDKLEDITTTQKEWSELINHDIVKRELCKLQNIPYKN